MECLVFLFIYLIYLGYLFVKGRISLSEYNSWNVEEMKARRNIEGLVAALKKYGKDKFGGHKQRTAEAALIEIGKPAVPALMTLYVYDNYDAVALMSMLDRIGVSQAVIKLYTYIRELNSSSKYERVSAAKDLVKMYYNGRLSPEEKRLILSVRHLITTPHTDKLLENACRSHRDHFDKGIGVEFPL
jgi:hypothetical protein